MDLGSLVDCFGSSACLVTQVTTGLIIAMLIFLVAAGVTLIFGVLDVINFAHGSFYMVGAYVAVTTYLATGSYALAVVVASIATAIFGILFERLMMSRVYGNSILMQLLVCYGFILIMDDVMELVSGPNFVSMGMPDTFRMPPFRLAGGYMPPFYLFLICMACAVAVVLWYIVERTKYGKVVRAVAQNSSMASALGIRTSIVYASVFGLGCLIVGLAGSLAAPVRPVTSGMGFSILIESFIVTVIGGMGSIVGAFVAAILLGMARAFGSIGFPLFVDGVMFMMMALVLIFKPSGLFGRRIG